MPIAVLCPGCGGTYELGDGLAGRRCRCKDCGTVFRVPEVRPSSAPRDLLSGLDRGPASAAPPSLPPRAASREPDLPPPPRGPRPESTRSRRSRETGGEPDPLYRYGMSLVVFGIIIAVLPLIGFQHQVVALLPEQGQAGVAIGCLALGGILLACSSSANAAQRAGKARGIGLLILGVGLAGWAFIKPDGPQPPPPQFGGPPGMPGAPPGFGGPPGPGDATDEPRYTLSNAQAGRATGPLGNARGMGIDFRVDYQLSGPMRVGPAVWVVESPRTKARDPMVHLQPGGGTLAGMLPFNQGDTGPFKTYLAEERGGSLVRISNTVDMAWRGDQGIGDPAPGPGPGPGPGPPTMPGPMPGGFRGPRGPFGPRGPIGPPPGFPRRGRP